MSPAPACRMLLLVLAACLGAALGQSQVQVQPGPAPDTSGWTAPGGPATPADSLASFRPDSMRNEAIRSAESAPSPLAAAPRSARDSADSVASLLRGRRPSLSVHLGIGFLDLDAKPFFSEALRARLAADTSLRTLQDYEAVHIFLPGGLQALLPMGPWFDLVAKTHSYMYSQKAVLGKKSGGGTTEEGYTVQAHLGGAGLRYYVPPDLLSVSGKLGLYVQGVYYWLLAGELYSSRGSAPADFDPAGSAWEVLLGFNRAVTRPWSLTGSLGFLQQDYASGRPWSAVIPRSAPAGNAHWGGGALQASFQLVYTFGIPPRPPAGAPVTGAGETPAQPSPAPVPGTPPAPAEPAPAPAK